MPLSDLEPLKIPITFGGKQLYLRYNLLAELYLEKQGLDKIGLIDKDLFDCTSEELVHILRGGFIDCFFDENDKIINNGDWNNIIPSFGEIARTINIEGKDEIILKIIEGFTAALPVPQITGTENFHQGGEI